MSSELFESCASFAPSPGQEAEGDPWELPRKNPLVFLAEDQDEMRSLIADALQDEGYDVVPIADGQRLRAMLRAADLAVREPPDLLITGVCLPGGNGLDALAELRTRDPFVPAIVITAFGDPASHARARRLGAATVLDKPFPPEELVARVQRLLPPPSEDVAAPL